MTLRRLIKAARLASAAVHRRSAKIARDDRRDWVVQRRERTRQLIELGGLVAKAGLVELVDDDRAIIFGILIEAAARLRASEDRERLRALWQRRGRRAFDQTIPDRVADP